MLGAIVGDIAGSRFEWDNHKSKDFELLTSRCRPTDDSIMTLAVAKAIMDCDGDYSLLEKKTIDCMQLLGRRYPNAGYGRRFYEWIHSRHPLPYNSFGNGAAMRVSPCGYAASSLEEAADMARIVTKVTHNHPEGMKAGEAVSSAVFLARNGKSMTEIREFIEENTTGSISRWTASARHIHLMFLLRAVFRRHLKRSSNRPDLRMRSATRYQSEATAIPSQQLPADWRKPTTESPQIFVN